MPDVVAVHSLKSGGRYHPPDSVVPIEDAHEAEALVARGAARWPGVAQANAAILEDLESEDTPLPDDFPGADALGAGGIHSLEGLRALLEAGADLTKLKGIGKATARKIEEALE